MSTTTARKEKNQQNKFDLNSIRTVMLLYFFTFAAVLIMLIWSLQSFFMTHYFEQMKVQETEHTAALLKNEFLQGDGQFKNLALNASASSDIFIRVDTPDGTSVFDNGSYFRPSSIAYDYETSTARDRLEKSNKNSVSLVANDTKKDSRKLIYATYIGDTPSNNILFIVAPLYPVKSTISILRLQLKYISFIALIVAALLALFIARRLSRPIKDITKSAMELSHGNYNVKFNGGMFTETNELARTLNTASYEMQKTDFYQRDLIANVSHDLKTPLTMIKSYAEMINDISGDNPEKRKEHLKVIITEADRLNKLVSDMLSASKIQSNNLELDKEIFDLVAVTEEIVATYKVLNEQNGYHIRLNKCKAAYVYGDKEKIKQVLSNFVSNAIKYCGEDRVVIVEVKRIGKKVRVDVIDHGDGIASDELSHVWERYYRTSANRNRSIEGSGLGLSIVKGILVLHNANYGVKSKVGQGSDFWFEMDTVKKPTDTESKNKTHG